MAGTADSDAHHPARFAGGRTQASMARLRAAGYDAPFLSLEDGVADYVANHLGKDDPYR